MKRLFLITTTLIISVCMLLPVYGADSYNDLNTSHWAYSFIEDMSKNNIVSGYPDGSFKPDNKVTYAEFIKLIYTTCIGEVLAKPSEGGHWASAYYHESIRAGLFNGSDIKWSDLDKEIPRKLMAVLISNGITILNGINDEKHSFNALERISDVDSESDYAYEIAVSYDSEILNGYPDGEFKPENGLIRSEACAAIYRLISNKNNSNLNNENQAEPDGSFQIAEKDYSAVKYNVNLGYNGIEKFVYSKENDCIGVYSNTIQDISLFSDKHKLQQVVNAEGEYWKEDGYFVYVFKAGGHYTSECELGIAFGLYIEEVFYYAGAK